MEKEKSITATCPYRKPDRFKSMAPNSSAEDPV
jgi:hypothetical protein